MWIKDEKPRLWFKMWQDGDGDLTRGVHREAEVCTEPVECSRCRKQIPINTEMHWQFPARNMWGEIRDYVRNRVLLRCGLCQYELDLGERLKPKALQDLMPWELPAHLLAREGEDHDSTVKRIAALRRDLAEIDDEATPEDTERVRRGNQTSWPEPTADGVSEPKEIHPMAVGIPEGSKRCRGMCDTVKVLAEFTVDAEQPDGRCLTCRACKSVRRKEIRANQRDVEGADTERRRRATLKARERRATEKATKALSE